MTKKKEEEMLKRPVSEEQCKKLGGHYWNHHGANDVTNKFGEFQGERHLVHYEGGEPQLRTCGLCGKTQRKIREWTDE